jgi:hypothetical protein
MTVASEVTRKSEETIMAPTGTIHERRCALRKRSEFTFVQRDEFCKLLLSTKRMIRSDEPAVQLRGLLDMETGARFLIEQEKLYSR